jgi:hypothetical protein
LIERDRLEWLDWDAATPSRISRAHGNVHHNRFLSIAALLALRGYMFHRL